ncbi:hypothetical protein [Leifsonia sp. SIMBA_070]|uniref:hypothetical protein n=2 Tax=Bacteria TaxID=2 RepID=UPI00397A4916
MAERGNTKHGPIQDEELKHEAQPFVQGHGPSHVEEWRQTEPMPDDTDDAEVVTASGVDGDEAPASDDVTASEYPGEPGATGPDTLAYSAETPAEDGGAGEGGDPTAGGER